LTLLLAIGIPVYFVLRFTVPEAAWIIRTLMILYAFSATLYLQFCPLMWNVLVKDMLSKNKDGSGSSGGSFYTHGSSGTASASASAM
jgi:hypothetical protein